MDDQESTQQRKPYIWIAIILAAVAFIAAIVTRRWRRRRAEELARSRRPVPPPPPIRLEGLSEAEAEARRVEGQDNAIHLKPPRSKQQIWRENVYNIFNLNLAGLAAAQLLLRQPLDALLSLGTIALNIGLNIGQEMLAQKRLSEVEEAARPQATVIREKKVRSIDPSEIVLGDTLVVGPGDQMLVDGEVIGEGQIAVDESVLTGKSVGVTKRAGDKVYAGSFCVSGRAGCKVQKVGNDRLIADQTDLAPAAEKELTPLERIIERVLRFLLLVVAVFTVISLASYFVRLDTVIDSDTMDNAVSVIFNIAPSGLYFMIVVTYAMGTADLAKLGALVHRARSVESLAAATVICFAKAGILTGTHVEIKLLESPDDQEHLAESRLRQILGDYAQTTSADNLATRAMVDTLEGNWRAAHEEAPFLSVYGWSAIAFDDDDLQGVYVLGDPQVLEAHLAWSVAESAGAEEKSPPLAAVRQMTAPVGRFFQRAAGRLRRDSASSAQREQPEAEQPQTEPSHEPQATREPEAAVPSEASTSSVEEISPADDTPKPNLFRRLGQRIRRVVQRGEAEPEEEEAPEDPASPETVLLFAYLPEPTPLHDAEGVPQLPEGLIPLCELHYTQRVRPEAIDTIRTFSRTGVGIKVFAAGPPDETATMLRQAGLGSDGSGSMGILDTISGPELVQLKPAQLARVAAENTIFGQVTPEQAGQIVAALREEGESVAVVGDGVSDLPAMRQANLAISRRSSTQAALSQADIVLLEDSPQVLSVVLDKGQRIVNGLLDVLKLNLTQVFSLALLILGIRLFSFGFPYASAQGTAIAVVTVAIPSVGLSLWAAAGVLPSASLSRLLSRFVMPAAILMSAAGLVVYVFFLDRTGELAYAQLTLTYTLVGCGLLLVIFVRPPGRAWLSGSGQRGDWRFVVLALALMVAFFLVSAVPLAQEFLKLDWLRQPSDYLVVGLAMLAWALGLRFVLRVIPVERRVHGSGSQD